MSKLKQNIQDNGGFQHWFVNVFWYHYKWPLLIGVVVLGIIVFITVDSLRKERYDTTVVIATDYFVDEEQLSALDQVLKPVVGDLDGNGKVNINYAVLYVGNTEVGRQNQERMYLYMSQEDVGLYLNATGSGTSGTVFEQLVLPGPPVELGATVEVKFAENTEPDNGLSSANGDWAEDPEQKDQTQPQTGN